MSRHALLVGAPDTRDLVLQQSLARFGYTDVLFPDMAELGDD